MIDDRTLLAPWAGYEAQPVTWPGGKTLAFWLAPNIEYYEIDPAPNPVRAPWPRPCPDLQNWSWRDYGNRVGVWRCLELFDQHGLKGSVSLNSAMCRHFPDVVQAFVDRGWELFCHGQYNTRYLFGRSPGEEREDIASACREIESFCGTRVRGLLSPALTYTETTLESAAACGIDYVFDLCMADAVVPLRLPATTLLAIPYSIELNDFFAVVAGGLSATTYVDRFRTQFDQLMAESARQPKVVGLPLHPYLIGMPQYVWALDRMLAHVRQHDGVWCTRARDIADHVWRHVLPGTSHP